MNFSFLCIAALSAALSIACGKKDIAFNIEPDDAAFQARAEIELKSTYSRVEVALSEFQSKLGRYPTQAEGLEALVSQPSGLKGWEGPYIDQRYIRDPWKRKFLYELNGNEPKIFSTGKSGSERIDLSILMNK